MIHIPGCHCDECQEMRLLPDLGYCDECGCPLVAGEIDVCQGCGEEHGQKECDQ